MGSYVTFEQNNKQNPDFPISADFDFLYLIGNTSIPNSP